MFLHCNERSFLSAIGAAIEKTVVPHVYFLKRHARLPPSVPVTGGKIPSEDLRELPRRSCSSLASQDRPNGRFASREPIPRRPVAIQYRLLRFLVPVQERCSEKSGPARLDHFER